jgi:hypothetical protein
LGAERGAPEYSRTSFELRDSRVPSNAVTLYLYQVDSVTVVSEP